jgi:hypothetical protein
VAGPAEDSYSLPPQPAGTVTHVRNFVTNLARAGKGYMKIRETMETVYGEKALKKMVIYTIIKR